MLHAGAILIVEPTGDLPGLRAFLERETYLIEATPDADRALDLLRTQRFDAAFVGSAGDLGGRALDLLQRGRRVSPAASFIMVGASAETGARAVARGATGLLTEPLDPAEIRAVLALAREKKRLDHDRAVMLEDARGTRRFFEDVLRGLGEGILVVNADGKIRYRNPEAARIIGEEDEDSREADREVPSSESIKLRQRVLAPLLQLMVETFTEKQGKSRMIVLEEEDRKLFFDATTGALRDGDGRIQSTVAIVRDRSAEKLLEEQLVHTERLATLGSLLASIAHEINNPLNVITGAAEIGFEAAREAEEAGKASQDPDTRSAFARFSADVKEILEQVKEAGLRCQRIAANLLQYSRRVPAQIKEEDVNEIIRRTLTFVGKYLGTDKVEVILALGATIPKVRVDASQLQQAITNLVDNAVHAMLDAAKNNPSPRRPKLTLKTTVEGGRATIRIIDEGPGMSEARLKHLWRPFYTTKQRGTGLGLFITRRVVEHQGGTIAVESQVGKGTTFTIQLPI